MRDPTQQVQDGQRNRDEHAVQHTEGQHCRGGGQCQDEFTASEACQPPELWHVDQRKAAYTTSAPSAAAGNSASTPLANNMTAARSAT